jgi:glycosyltransferase involved in cell wall biosynthesis
MINYHFHHNKKAIDGQMLPKTVMMIGPEIISKGGISAVIQNYKTSGLFEDCSIVYYSTYRDGRFANKILFYLKKLGQVSVRLKQYRIVHINSSYGWSFRRLAIIFWLAVASGKKTIFHIHSGHFQRAFLNANRLESLLIRKTLRQADIVIVLSREWESTLRNICPEARFEILENAVDLEKFNIISGERRCPEPPYRILFMGRLGEQKGVYDIIETASFLPQDQYTFIMAGDGEVEEVTEKIKEKGLQSMFVIPGWISGKLKFELLQKADLFLLPSYHEGLPMSILEAMAASLPIVATSVGGIPSAVENEGNGYLISPGNPRLMAKAIEQVFSDMEKWKRFSSRSLQIAQERFNMAKIKDKLGKIYQELLYN